jgi:LuxR family maltose regulon positive regulatory protein
MEWMEQANLFTIPLDDQKYWYRFHHLFRNVLHLHATEKYGADEVFTLHLRAGEWFADNNMLEEAIGHYIKGNAVEKAVELFARHRIGLQNGKQWPKMQRLLNLFPFDSLDEYPELAFSNAWVMIYQGKTLDMFEKLPHLESLLKNMKSSRERSDNLTGELYVLQAYKIYNMEMDYHNVHDLTHTAIEKLDSHDLYVLGLAWIFFGG